MFTYVQSLLCGEVLQTLTHEGKRIRPKDRVIVGSRIGRPFTISKHVVRARNNSFWWMDAHDAQAIKAVSTWIFLEDKKRLATYNTVMHKR